MAEKRYYWLKLKEDFFTSKRIKKLRKMAGGDTYTIIYLKMQLKSLRNGGKLEYTGLEDNFAEELALDIDEKPDDVKMTLAYLLNCGLVETSDEVEYFMPFVNESVGSENASAARVRKYRAKQLLLQSNDEVTNMKQIGNGDIEKEIDIEKDIDILQKNVPLFVKQEESALEDTGLFDNQQLKDWYKRLEAVYPKMDDPTQVLIALDRVCPDEETFEQIIQAVDTYKQSDAWKKNNGQYISKASKWLRDGMWKHPPFEYDRDNSDKQKTMEDELKKFLEG